MSDENTTDAARTGDTITDGGSDLASDGAGVAAIETAAGAEQASHVPPPSQAIAASSGTQRSAPINVDNELAAKELLADKLGAGLIQYDEYAKAIAGHDRNIITAQRQERAELQESIRPIQQAKQVSDSNRIYFQAWGNGKDVANIKYGKTITSATAQKLFKEAETEFENNPMYKDRPEFDATTVVRMKWLEKLEAASKATAKGPTPVAAVTQSTRFSGSGGAQAVQADRDTRTAKQKLDAGEYPGLIEDTERFVSGTR